MGKAKEKVDLRKIFPSGRASVWDWKAKTKAGLVCGMMGCDIRPAFRCERCGAWYCRKHIRLHEAVPHMKKKRRGLPKMQGVISTVDRLHTS